MVNHPSLKICQDIMMPRAEGLQYLLAWKMQSRMISRSCFVVYLHCEFILLVLINVSASCWSAIIFSRLSVPCVVHSVVTDSSQQKWIKKSPTFATAPNPTSTNRAKPPKPGNCAYNRSYFASAFLFQNKWLHNLPSWLILFVPTVCCCGLLIYKPINLFFLLGF